MGSCMINWWEIGDRWRAAQAGLAHGGIERSIRELAASDGLAANTVRRCSSARVFADDLVSAGLVATHKSIAGLPLKTMGVLQRVSRYGEDELRLVLHRVLGSGTLTGAELTKIEQEVRTRTRPDVGQNSHALRLRSREFRTAVLAALERQAAVAGWRLVRITSREAFDPLVVDAVILSSKASAPTGIRLLPETAGATARWRAAEAFVGALAAARAFDAVVLIVEATSDAADMTARLERVGPCGVGLTRLDSTNSLMVERAPTRLRKPDLTSRYAGAFDALSSAVEGFGRDGV